MTDSRYVPGKARSTREAPNAASRREAVSPVAAAATSTDAAADSLTATDTRANRQERDVCLATRNVASTVCSPFPAGTPQIANVRTPERNPIQCPDPDPGSGLSASPAAIDLRSPYAQFAIRKPRSPSLIYSGAARQNEII